MSEHLVLTTAETAAERREFIEFPWQVYRGDPFWVPPLISERVHFLDPHGHPFHQHAKVRYFVARRNGQPVGTIAGIVNQAHNQHWNDKVGFFGLFEVLDDPEAAQALLEAAEQFVAGEGLTAIRGPFSFSTNEECGLLVEGWNGPPVALMTYNPRYYPALIEAAGYTKAMDLVAYLVDLRQYRPDGTGLNPKLLRTTQKVKERLDITIRPGNLKNFDAEAVRFRQVYNAAWARNWGFVPLTEAELVEQMKSLKPLLDPGTVFFAEERNGRPVGVTLPIPDLNQPLRRAYPRPGVPEWFTMAKLLYWWKVRKTVTTIRGFAGGVIEEYRGRGVEGLLVLETMLAAIRHGYHWLELSWILETNLPMRQTAEYLYGQVYRTYRIYEKALPPHEQ